MTHKLRLVGANIAILAVLLHALLPVGWMPNTTGSGSSFITICSMNGPTQIEVGNDGQPVKKHQPAHDGTHQICPFAVAAHFAPPAKAIVPALVALVYAADRQIGYSYLLASPTHHSPQAPRAPPHRLA
jgi:hypothetical protein